MIPILFEKTETEFTSNGLGRLYDMARCEVTEERNGIYEVEFDYPVMGQNFNKIKIGRIIGVEHGKDNNVQPFDIVGATKPINGLVTFHAVHISYRLNKVVATGRNINSLAEALAFLQAEAEPENPFSFFTDKESDGYLPSADGIPKSVRSYLGGIEGSILDTYGGEYEWDKFMVNLWAARGIERSVTVRYGVNMTDFTDETSNEASFNACVPYWADAETGEVVSPGVVELGESSATGRTEVVPFDMSGRYETRPTSAQLEGAALSYMRLNKTNVPTKTISVNFLRLQDSEEYASYASLLECSLCDTIRVVFPWYETDARFKIVRTVYDVLGDRYISMELGALSTTLSQALGIQEGSTGTAKSAVATVIETGTEGIWTYRKWSDGTFECWGNYGKQVAANATDTNNYVDFPVTFEAAPIATIALRAGGIDLYGAHIESAFPSTTQIRLVLINKYTAAVTLNVQIHVIGKEASQ